MLLNVKKLLIKYIYSVTKINFFLFLLELRFLGDRKGTPLPGYLRLTPYGVSPRNFLFYLHLFYFIFYLFFCSSPPNCAYAYSGLSTFNSLRS